MNITQKEYVIQLIKIIEQNMFAPEEVHHGLSIGNKGKDHRFWLRYSMPYCSKKLKSGKTIFLNRGYNPIFYFEDSNNQLKNEYFENIAFQIDKDEQHFYDDGCNIWDSQSNLKNYINKLKDYLDL